MSGQPEGTLAGLLCHKPDTLNGGAIVDTGHSLTCLDILSIENDQFVVCSSALNAIPVRVDFRTGHRLGLALWYGLALRQRQR